MSNENQFQVLRSIKKRKASSSLDCLQNENPKKNIERVEIESIQENIVTPIGVFPNDSNTVQTERFLFK